jgi:N-acetylmuramoyl-L-alanine amidase
MASNIIPKPCAAANFHPGRPSHLTVEAIVIHLIDGSQVGCDATFADTALAVRRSAHYSVGRDGKVHRYVDERDTAFHCGVVVNPTWEGLKKAADGRIINPNFYTIGIEHEGRVQDEWTPEMYAASSELMREIASRFPALQPLTRRNVVMHREIRATKACPGPKADLARLISAAGGPPLADPRALRTRTNVNVRRGQPTTTAPLVRTIPAGEVVNVRAMVTGEPVQGISRWYQNMDDDFVWAGALAE